jgi:hypothetical protein
VAFLLTLTDARVRNESAPFDHPHLFIPEGQRADGSDIMLEVPAVGGKGQKAQKLPPLDPSSPNGKLAILNPPPRSRKEGAEFCFLWLLVPLCLEQRLFVRDYPPYNS